MADKETGATHDTEITLGTGKLLGIFFAIVAVCAVFFTMGYLFGHGSAAAPGTTTIVGAVPAAGNNTASKPSAGGSKTTDAQNCPAGSSNCTPASPDSNLYNPVSSKDAAASQVPVAQTSSTPPDANNNGTPQSGASAVASYMVQVAAVSKQEDADILVNALRKKQYPVFVAANVAGDSLFHVQMGPFTDRKDAESMRARLAADGYNAIVK